MTGRPLGVELQSEELSTWPRLPRPDLIDRLSFCVRELFGLYQELALVEAEERDARVRAHASSDGQNVSSRDRDGAAAALMMTTEALKLKGRISALESAREFGYVLLGMGS